MRGFELPGVSHLKKALDVLKEEGIDVDGLAAGSRRTRMPGAIPPATTRSNTQSPAGRSVVLKLKTAPDVANGILDQYELGPYNLMILGESSSWRGEPTSLVLARASCSG